MGKRIKPARVHQVQLEKAVGGGNHRAVKGAHFRRREMVTY